MKILFFIESLQSGGKERRLVELLSYLRLNSTYTICLVLTNKEIHYKKFLGLNIPYYVIEKNKAIKGLNVFYKFYKIVKEFNPDIVHTWGNITTFFSLPAIFFLRKPLINNQISDAPPKIKKFTLFYLITRINFCFSNKIISNSNQGLISYGLNSKKCLVIYNGMDLSRFEISTDPKVIKNQFHIKLPNAVIMVGSFTIKKDYRKFCRIAKQVGEQREDIAFIAAGDGPMLPQVKKYAQELSVNNILFTGRISQVEELVNVCDLGVLFSPEGEGLSNAILEYMALGKPVIANNLGGNSELITSGVNGFLFSNETEKQISEKIIQLFENRSEMNRLGTNNKLKVSQNFNLQLMGIKFEEVYKGVYSN